MVDEAGPMGEFRQAVLRVERQRELIGLLRVVQAPLDDAIRLLEDFERDLAICQARLDALPNRRRL